MIERADQQAAAHIAASLPLAANYAALLDYGRSPPLREAGSHPYRSGFHWTERHLQCLWFDSRYRPDSFYLPQGETLTVLDPGVWNLEAGPDFLNATLMIQPGARRIQGDVEIHVRPVDWDLHRHSSDPAYSNVVAHVTWFPGPAAKTLPPDLCAVSLNSQIMARTDLDLGDIDIRAYPHAILPATPRPCQEILHNQPDQAENLLRSAGHYRLQLKATRLATRLLHGVERQQLFYEEVMAALGYKHNQQPFRALARLVPASSLAPLDRHGALASLLGTANLLPQPESMPDSESQHFVRSLWDLWWRNSAPTLPPEIKWHTHGLRPQNSPQRRLATAASLFTGMDSTLHQIDRLKASHPTQWHSGVVSIFEKRTGWLFWNQRLALSSLPNPGSKTALLGRARIAAIVTNVLLPLLTAEGDDTTALFEQLPPEDLSSPMKLAALYLFGRDHNPAAIYNFNGVLQQGLLQIYLDFCLNARPECEGCLLCQALQNNPLHADSPTTAD